MLLKGTRQASYAKHSTHKPFVLQTDLALCEKVHGSSFRPKTREKRLLWTNKFRSLAPNGPVSFPQQKSHWINILKWVVILLGELCMDIFQLWRANKLQHFKLKIHFSVSFVFFKVYTIPKIDPQLHSFPHKIFSAVYALSQPNKAKHNKCCLLVYCILGFQSRSSLSIFDFLKRWGSRSKNVRQERTLNCIADESNAFQLSRRK